MVARLHLTAPDAPNALDPRDVFGLDAVAPATPRVFDHPEELLAAVWAGIDDVAPAGTWPGEAALLGLAATTTPKDPLPARLVQRLDGGALRALLPEGGAFLGLAGHPREDLTALARRLRHRLPYLRPTVCTGYSPNGRVSWDERTPPRFVLPLPWVFVAWRAQWAGDWPGPGVADGADGPGEAGLPVPPVEAFARAMHPGLDPEVLAYEVWLFSASILANARAAGILTVAAESA
jgi:hypothetical protein